MFKHNDSDDEFFDPENTTTLLMSIKSKTFGF